MKSMKFGIVLLCLALLAALAMAAGFPQIRQMDCQTDDKVRPFGPLVSCSSPEACPPQFGK